MGDADGRRSSAGCVVDLRVRTRSAGEGSPATREARTPGASTLAVVGAGRHDSTPTKGGQVTCTVSWAHSVSQGLRYKGPRTLSTPLAYEGVFLLFLYDCCGAVSNK